MQVELSSLRGKNGRFSHVYERGELVFHDERVGLTVLPTVSGRITQSDSKIAVEGKVNAVARVECDRCLKPVTLPIDAEFKVEYVTSEAYKELEAAELADEDLSLSVFDGEVIDIDEIVREQVLLAVPSQALCDPNCKGLCPICGTDLNLTSCSCQQTEIDPRWQGLKELVNRK